MKKNTLSKVEESIKIIRLAAAAAERKGSQLELCYSGGKDSEIMRVLADMAGVKYDAVYKQTTIDRPQTTRYVLEHGARIIRPSTTFFQLVAKKGFPTRRCRWCCERLKEYKVHDVALVGVRQAESAKRATRYTDITQCRNYHRGGNVEQFYPLLHWFLDDEVEFVQAHGVRLHPHYYRENGSLDLSRRLGCIGCPLKGDNGKGDLKEYPLFLRQLLISSYKWWNITKGTTKNKFSSPQKLLIHNLYCRSYDEYRLRFENVLFGFSDFDALLLLSQQFNIPYEVLERDFICYIKKS